MDNSKIAKRLQELRISKGVSSMEVANACGISRSAIQMYETGERIPRDEIKIKLATYFNTSVESIFFV